MMTAPKLSLVALAVLAATGSTASLSGTGNPAIAGLAGRWAGDGSYTLAQGPSRPFKCVVTYFTDGDTTRIRQNLRCQGGDYKLDAATDLQFRGNDVSGQWEDKVNALNGTVRGRVTADGFDVDLSGRFFSANMVVVSDGCQQSVTVTPERTTYVREVSAQLRKC